MERPVTLKERESRPSSFAKFARGVSISIEVSVDETVNCVRKAAQVIRVKEGTYVVN